MSELKAYTSVDIEEMDNAIVYNTGKLDCTRVYLKSEADKVIAHHKHKRCLANAWWCLREEFYAEDCHCERWVDWAIKWHKRWLELAEKFKEAK